MTAIALLKLVHVALALVAVGTNLSFPIWIRLAERDGSHLAFTLGSIRRIDRGVTIPAYGLVALTGIALAVAEGISFATVWIAVPIALFIAVIAAGFVLYAPVSRRRLLAAERGGAADPEFRREQRRADLLDVFVVPSVLAILALMVLRPA